MNADIDIDNRKRHLTWFYGWRNDVQSAQFETDGTPAARSKADSSTIAVYAGIPGNTLETKFNYIAQFSQDIDTNPAKIKGMDPFLAANSAKALVHMGDLARRFSATVAGEALEAVISLMVEGTQVGKSSR